MAAGRRREREEETHEKPNTKILKKQPDPAGAPFFEPRFRMFRFSIKAYPRSSDQFECYICGAQDHLEHFCPYNCIYGRFDCYSCRGEECPPGPGQHTITSRAHRKFLQCLVRVSNLPPGFWELDVQELFRPFGPLLMWDVPRFKNDVCGCGSEIRMRFGVLVFKKRADGERAINERNGYEAGGCKLRVDWAYPSCV